MTRTTPKVIRNREEYDATLREIGDLVARDPESGTPDSERLDLLVVLARDYESQTLPRVTVDPIDAIQFHMEQQDLKQKDLVPYFGSKSKVSEVLSRKRPLTLAMIRELHTGLGIPAESLLGQRDASLLEPPAFDWEQFPLSEMVRRRWVSGSVRDIKARGEELVRELLAPLGKPEAVLVMYRKTGHVRSGRKVNRPALTAWTARVVGLADQVETTVRFEPGSINLEVLREIARLSWSDQGPKLAQEFLAKRLGIPLIVERQLPGTHLDGAAIQGAHGPVIGMTIRHDRIDNFWFCLMHELVHIWRHFASEIKQFYDDLDGGPAEDRREREADEIASEALIPADLWATAPARSVHRKDAVIALATKLQIHPAIVAGRIRKEFNRFSLLSGMVGQGEVLRQFEAVAGT